MFFTRLPLWRLVSVPAACFQRVVPLWPLAGWVTGGLMALTLWAALLLQLPAGVAVAAAMAARCLLTGALHEDGWADFCDGFGAGTSREHTLSIMKDSHIGTYGVLALLLHFLLTWNLLVALLQAGFSPLGVMAADALAKGISASIVCFLPYARSAAEAKNRLVYNTPTLSERIICALLALTPLAVASLLHHPASGIHHSSFIPPLHLWALALLLPATGCALLFRLMHRRIQGYTGDCCGATVIVTETLLYLSLCVIVYS